MFTKGRRGKLNLAARGLYLCSSDHGGTERVKEAASTIEMNDGWELLQVTLEGIGANKSYVKSASKWYLAWSKIETKHAEP